MKSTLIGLGGNIGDVRETFDHALERIKVLIGPIIKKSSLYKTEPWGNKNQGYFLNMVVEVATSLYPEQILEQILSIEISQGRTREISNQYAPRTLDIDILFYDDLIINDGKIVIPHPRLHERNFVLVPLMEIAPDFLHPVLQKKVSELCKESKDQAVVTLN